MGAWTLEAVTQVQDAFTLADEHEPFDRAGHFFTHAGKVICAANDLRGMRSPLAQSGVRAGQMYTPQLLDLLSSGRTDEAAARSMGVGLRTYRRRVAELMSALGATSRFQAGTRAREAGLL